MTHPTLRPGVADDAGLLLAMFDGAVAWLAERGRDGQWGSTPWSQDPKRVERVKGMASGGKLLVAEFDGSPAGALILTEQPPAHIPPVTERELYVDLLITSREHTGRGVGSFLLDHARVEARRRGIDLVRVDCWAGGDGALVRYYRGQGFTPTERFHVGDWVGQVFEDRLDAGDVG
ncbi:GNAT family N-acetyltransferase [Prauserella cavernicola]|uniref:GNAT family N-acetyltransferase n=1 Tax=Prauserella cavernicola TaxID=2800127 RepID=A0A934V6K4_9PSEU|nr:GNAT family N-acetyltransferase [Prauserella cavernicola]MBK1785773.1 GNAT family N-acetyltransferase [Prauserella cavernicola]